MKRREAMLRRCLLLTLLALGCERAQPEQLLTLDFVATSDGQPWRCGRLAAHPELQLAELRFFLHELRAVDDRGVEHPARLVPEPGWTSETLSLLDLAPATLECAGGRAGHTRLQLRTSAHPITELRFRLGLPFAENHANPATADGPLAVGAMSWGWQAGHKFLKLEATVAGRPVRVHLGETGCEGTFGHVSACRRSNRAAVALRASVDAAGAQVRAPLEAAGAQVPAPLEAGGAQVRAPLDGGAQVRVELAPLLALGASEPRRNCMGDPDEACAPAFAALGLDAATGQPSAAQRLFRLAPAAAPSGPSRAAPSGPPSAAPSGPPSAAPSLLRVDAPAAHEARSGFAWSLPAGFPLPIVPSDNPMSREKVELGRRLFYDRSLSANRTQSCGSCHQQRLAFTDGRARAVGSTGALHRRSSMSLVNVAYASRLTWANPMLDRLEDQALLPMFGDAPVELGLTSARLLTDRLEQSADYRARFARAFPDEPRPISLGNVVKAIAAFERTILSGDSAYDRFLRGDPHALDERAQRGLRLFQSDRLECFHCHGGFDFTDSVTHAGLREPERAFHNTGLYNVDGRGGYPPSDRGLFELTWRDEDMGKFRAPTLRNIAVTAPYMHDGSIATLREAVAHYARGGRQLTAGPHAGDGARSPRKEAFLAGFTLSPSEEEDLLAFLRSLTDESLLTDPRLADPFAQNAM